MSLVYERFEVHPPVHEFAMSTLSLEVLVALRGEARVAPSNDIRTHTSPSVMSEFTHVESIIHQRHAASRLESNIEKT